jgi:5-bromo-4-chloroindolyl phosphate hydrolysis protein
MKILRWIISAAISSGIFALLFIVVDAGSLISLLLGGTAFAGGALLLSPEKIDPMFEALAKEHGITPAQLKKILKNGKAKVNTLRDYADDVKDGAIKKEITEIADTAEKIFQNFSRDPKDIKAARQFITYYLDAAINVIKQYSDLSDNAPDKKDFQVKVTALLKTINKSFETQLKKLYEDDFLNLDVEMKVLEKTIRSEGLG